MTFRAPVTLAIDIGGSGVKGSVLTPEGTMMVDPRAAGDAITGGA
jgi:hypothetical protein